jgi:hypothetical protein
VVLQVFRRNSEQTAGLMLVMVPVSPHDVLRLAAEQALGMTKKRGFSSNWVLALVIARAQKQLAAKYPEDYELMDAIDLANRAMPAIELAQSELFPLEKRKTPRPLPYPPAPAVQKNGIFTENWRRKTPKTWASL